ncbi:Uncharacterised protein [Pseudomonas putida]|nr:Uncharacterised protein [Pseudomonas putida]
MMMSASPSRAASQASRRSRSFTAECSRAMRALKRCSKRARVCGPRLISGISTRACLPASSVSRISCRYTSVLPLPVTPASRKAPKPPKPSRTASNASRCSSLSGSSGCASQCSWRSAGRWRRSSICTRSLASSRSRLSLFRLSLASRLWATPCGCWARVLRASRWRGARAMRGSSRRAPGATCQKRSWRISAGSPWRSRVGKAQLSVSPRLCW